MKRFLLNPQMRGVLRHVLSSLGPLLAAHGFTTDAYWQALVGVLMAVIAVYDSVQAKKPQEPTK